MRKIKAEIQGIMFDLWFSKENHARNASNKSFKKWVKCSCRKGKEDGTRKSVILCREEFALK